MSENELSPGEKLNESSLTATKKLIEEETKIKDRARQLKEKLKKATKKKEQQMEKKLKERLISEYQKGFEDFKEEFQAYTQSELTSLELVRQFRNSEICDFEGCIKSSMRKMEKNSQQIEEKQKELQASLKEAIQFLQQQKEAEMKEVLERLQIKKANKILEYKKSIQIQ